MARKQKHIYFDYAATTSLDPRVRRAMDPFFSVQFGNPGSLHRFGVQASRAVFEARRSIGVAIGASPHEVIFTASATEANNLALRGVIREFRVQGLGLRKSVRPRIIVSAIEHESILETARDLEKEGAEVVVIPVSRYGSINLPKLEAALNDRTVLVSVMYANNEIGTIQPIIAISDTIKQFKKEKFSSPKNPRTKWWPYTNHVPSCAGDEDIYDEMALVLADMLPYIFTVLQEKKSCSEVTELLKEYKDDTPSEPGMPVRFVSPAFLYVYGFYIAAAAYWAYTEAFRTLLDERGKVVIAHIGTFEKTSSGVTFTGEQSMLELIEANIEE